MPKDYLKGSGLICHSNHGGDYTITSNASVTFNDTTTKVKSMEASVGVLTDSISELTVSNGTAITNDLFLPSTYALYLGDYAVDGTWRLVRSGNDLAVQRREAGTYVSKSIFTP